MALTLQRFTVGDTSYVTKHNANADALELAVNALSDQVAANVGLSVPTAIRAIFGNDPRRLGNTSVAPTINVGVSIDVDPGYVWLPDVSGGVVVLCAGGTIVFTAAAADDYFINVSATGSISRATTSSGAIYQVGWNGTGFTYVTLLTRSGVSDEDWTDARTSVQFAAEFDTIGERISTGETATQKLLAVTINVADVTPATTTILEAQFIRLTGTLTGDRNLIVPDVEKFFAIENGTTGAYTVTVKTAAGTGIDVDQGTTVTLYCDGTDVVEGGGGGGGGGVDLSGTSSGDVLYNNAGAIGGLAELTLEKGGTSADLSSVTALRLVRMNAGATALEDSGKVVADFALASHNHAASEITSGTLALARGGGAADLSGVTASQLIRMNAGATALEGSGKTIADVVLTTDAQPYDLLTSFGGQPTSSQVIFRAIMVRSVAWPANFSGSQSESRVASTASKDFDIKKNGSSIGTMTYAASASSATFVSSGGSAQSAVAGDQIDIVAPASADVSLEDIYLGIKGTR